jgi:hypothetical protein
MSCFSETEERLRVWSSPKSYTTTSRSDADGNFTLPKLPNPKMIIRTATDVLVCICAASSAELLRQQVLDHVEAAHVRLPGPQPGAGRDLQVLQGLPRVLPASGEWCLRGVRLEDRASSPEMSWKFRHSGGPLAHTGPLKHIGQFQYTAAACPYDHSK